VNENLTKYGKTMYNNCLEQLLCDMNLYQQFSHMVINKLKGETTEEFSFTLEHVIISEKWIQWLLHPHRFAPYIMNLFKNTFWFYLLSFAEMLKVFLISQKQWLIGSK